MTAPLLPVYAVCRHRIAQDGDGVVSLVAVSGCPLHCAYCLNPEGRDASAPSIPYTPEALYERLRIDDLYFQATGGGVTFGGGEPLMHADFLRAFEPLIRDRWKLRVETSLHVPEKNIYINADLFIVDIKDTHDEIYAQYTGGNAALAQGNLARLLKFAGPERVIVRVPLIPGYNSETLRAESILRLRDMGVTQIDAFTYRTPPSAQAEKASAPEQQSTIPPHPGV